MECKTSQTWMFRRLDDELSIQETKQLDFHLLQCADCARELKMLMIPRQIVQGIPDFQVSPFFYSKLKARIQSETCVDSSFADSIWSMILRISRQVVPALGTITLAVLLTFAYLQIWSTGPDIYQAFDTVFTSSDRPGSMVIADQGEITDDSVLLAIADQQAAP